MASSTSPSNTTNNNSKNVFRLHGVNVLNKNDVDSITRQTALEKRRAAHIVDERQRRDTMNQLMAELGHLAEGSAADVQAQLDLQQAIPNPDGSEKRPIVKSNSITTLRNAIAEIHRLRSEVGLKRLASYKEVLVSYRSTPSSGVQPSRRNKRPETDLFTSSPMSMSTPPPYNHNYHSQQPHHHDPSNPISDVEPQYHYTPPAHSAPPLFSTPESLNYQDSLSPTSSSSSSSHNLPQQRPNLHERQQPARQRIYLPWCSHLASSYPPIRPMVVPQPQPQAQIQPSPLLHPYNGDSHSPYSSPSPPRYSHP